MNTKTISGGQLLLMHHLQRPQALGESNLIGPRVIKIGLLHLTLPCIIGYMSMLITTQGISNQSLKGTFNNQEKVAYTSVLLCFFTQLSHVIKGRRTGRGMYTGACTWLRAEVDFSPLEGFI